MSWVANTLPRNATVLETLYPRAASRALSSELTLRLRDPISSLASVQMPGPSVWDGGALSVAVDSLVGEWEWEIDRLIHHGGNKLLLEGADSLVSLQLSDLISVIVNLKKIPREFSFGPLQFS